MATVGTVTVGAAGSLTVTAAGYPIPTLGVTGALPTGVSFHDNGDGTATLAGTPALGTAGRPPPPPPPGTPDPPPPD